jgi:eukaryotic-like serine/threonine-protein kinase
MSAPSTVDDLVALIRKSGLVEPDRLEDSLQRFRAAADAPARPEDLARLLVGEGTLTPFQAHHLLQGKARGYLVGEYRVLGPLGAGGMGSVYLCEHRGDGRKVAIKILPKDRAEEPEFRKRFQREGRAVSALDHKNIVRAYGMGFDGKRHFFVMEYIDGCHLADLVKMRGALEISRACVILCQAAAGLQHIHEMGLVHRDIKPANVLIDRAGTVKIFDMGLARVFADEELLTTRVVGTADFIAPEQTYDSHGVDIRADIYSLGATAYFLLTGTIPFGKGTVVEKIEWHRKRQPDPIRTLRPEVPEGLAAVVEKMMAKDRRQRYQTPADVIVALAPWCGKGKAIP